MNDLLNYLTLLYLKEKFSKFSTQMNLTENKKLYYDTADDMFFSNFTVYEPLVIHVFSSAICFYTGRTACKLLMQKFGFSLPMTLTTPLTCGLMLLLSVSSGFQSRVDLYTGSLGKYFYLDGVSMATELFTIAIGLSVFWLSQLWVSGHIWFPKLERMAKNERIFCVPYYDTSLIDQSMMLNRHRLDEIISNTDLNESAEEGKEIVYPGM